MTQASRTTSDARAIQASDIDWTTVRRVLLIRLRSIGDTVLMTPCLSELKAWQPRLEISVITEPTAAPLLENHPLVDKLIIARSTLGSRLALAGQLRRERYDLAFNLHGGTTATFIAALSGARHTVGYRAYRYSRLLTKRAPAPELLLGRKRVHSVEQQLALLYWSGVPETKRPRLSLAVSPEALARVKERLGSLGLEANGSREPNFACIAPAAAFASKRWPSKRFADVACHLRDRWGLPSVVIAGAGEEHLAREVRAAIDDAGSKSETHILTGLSLEELVTLLSLASVFVGNDSGPAHIAAAFDRPMVVVFGSSNPNVWHPWTESAYKIICPAGGPEIDDREIDSIAPVAVTQAVDEVIEQAAQARLEIKAGVQR